MITKGSFMMTDAVMLFCAVLGLVGFVVSLICVAMIAGFLRSTHTVQYVPAEPTKVDIPDPLAFFNEEEEEKEILEKVGKKKPADPIISQIDEEMEEITKSDSLY